MKCESAGKINYLSTRTAKIYFRRDYREAWHAAVHGVTMTELNSESEFTKIKGSNVVVKETFQIFREE